jgi:integrase
MARPKGSFGTPSYRRHKPTGQAVVTLGGRDFYLGDWKSRASKIEYERLVGEFMANGRRSAANDLTVTELTDRFWTHAQAYYRRSDGTPTSEAGCFKRPLKILNRLYGHTPAANFGPIALESVRNEMIKEGWCRSSINAQTNRLRHVFKWGASRELISADVHRALTTLPPLKMGRTTAAESEPVRPVAEAVVEATLPHCSTVIAAMIQLARLTGARAGEICMLRTGDIDRSGPVWVYRPLAHKNAHRGHRREICIGPKAQAVLAPFLKPLNPAGFIFSPADAVEELRQQRAEARTTPNGQGNCAGMVKTAKPKWQPGEKYDAGSFRLAIRRACDRADAWAKGGLIVGNDERLIPRWHPHQLRHLVATEVRVQFGLDGSQVMLGHRHANVTEIYAEQNTALARKIAAVVG